MNKINKVIATVLVLTFTSTAFASSPPPKKYTPVSRSHTVKEEAFDMGVMVVALWAGYAATQYDVVSRVTPEHWNEHLFKVGAVGYDQDWWVVNFIGHPYVGSEYYLYFRSRGYAPKWAFVGCLATSTIFEAAVESATEPFSTNDFVVTPIFGSLLGYAREKAALRLLQTNSEFNRVIGHILYLETNFWFFEKSEIMPAVSPDGKVTGFSVVAVF